MEHALPADDTRTRPHQTMSGPARSLRPVKRGQLRKWNPPLEPRSIHGAHHGHDRSFDRKVHSTALRASLARGEGRRRGRCGSDQHLAPGRPACSLRNAEPGWGGCTGRPAEHADSAASGSGPLEQRAQLKPAAHVRIPCEGRGEIEMQFQDVLGWAAAAPTLLAFSCNCRPRA